MSPVRAVDLAIVIVATSIACPPSAGVIAASVVAFVVLAVQIVMVRPGLTRCSDQLLAGLDTPRSRGHYVYVGLEAIKVLALAAAGLLLLSS
ncbi:hypothetical protein [Mycobacterium sp.]|uniref:hypothetical protein n=1 Tax=Mycobacterium sp. TaxID=1785 RepID=UPI003BB1186F